MAEQYVVPQFIDVEDKILGPITARQFVIMLIDVGIMFIVYKLASLGLMIFINLSLLAIGIVLAFVKVNGMPFHYFLLNIVATTKNPNVRVWNKEYTDTELKSFMNVKPPPPEPQKVYKEAPTTSRLAELTLQVNTGGAYQSEE